MKINRVLLLLLVALYVPMAAVSQTIVSSTDYVDFTLNESASTTNYYVPFVGQNVTYGSHCQFIIPATSLQEMTGGQVRRLTFYSYNQNISWGEAEYTVYVAEVYNTSFATATLYDWNTLTQVYCGSLSINNNYQMVIELDDEFIYNGGNLLIGFRETVLGTGVVTRWYGVSGTSYSTVYAVAINSSGNLSRFKNKNLPKLTFNYLPSVCPKVDSINVVNISTTTADFSWTAPSDNVTGYAYQFKLASSNEWPTDWSNTTDTLAEISGLSPITEYDFRVKALYGEYESAMTTIRFMTECPEMVSVPYSEDFDSYAVASSWVPSAVHLLPLCWDYINESTAHPNQVFPTMYYTTSFNFANSVPNSLIFNIYNTIGTEDPQPQYVILPPMQNINELRVRLNARIYSPNYISTFKVGVMEGTDASTFTAMGTITPFIMGYVSYTINLNGYEGTGNRIAILMEVPSAGYDSRVLIDDIVVEQIPVFTKEIAAYHTNEEGWYLIASPLAGETNPGDVTYLINNNLPNFDLYRFNSTPIFNPTTNQVKEWENWKQVGDHYHFNLESGRGYLYASAEDVTLSFMGTPYSGNGEVTLIYDENAPSKGWNLVGNPFSVPAYLGDRAFYRMNANGSGFEAGTGSAIEAMEGIFVYTETDGEQLTFSPMPPTRCNEQLAVSIDRVEERSGTTTTIDRAILRFDEGDVLPKFQFRTESAKVYIPQNGQDYAVITAGGQGEMPINFRADQNGTYTLSLSFDNVEFSYLHLFDNKTGIDTDLLSTPSYTFNSTTTDYESRFKLVFATGSSVDNDSFSFINSNGNFSIFGVKEETTLQVFDMMGRMLSSETFSSNIEKRLDVAPGVYVIRLVNGDDVKTQKIVVR